MADATIETRKRLKLANEIKDQFKDISLGIILSGSVAYSPNLNVTKDSDVDLVIVTDHLKKTIPLFTKNEKKEKTLKNRFFEGYCVKNIKKGIPVSYHILSEDAFDIISKCFVSNIRVYRESPKKGAYKLNGFEGNTYDYFIKNIPLKEIEKGVRTIVPISFIKDDRYFIGIHRDKLLSNPKIMYSKKSYVSGKIDKLWKIVVENLCDESKRVNGSLDLNKMNILNALAKKDKMSKATKTSIKEKTEFYLSRLI